MPCGQKCKEILDNTRAMQQSVECMVNSILLNAANNGEGPPGEMSREMIRKMEEVAQLAQRIAEATNPDGSMR